MRVLSLFDGMSCGQIALKEIGITPEVYYASEIDKSAIKQTQLNFPNTIQVGDVRDLNVEDLGHIDLILAGSPCTDMSFSGKRKGLSTVEGIEIKSLNEYLELKKQGFGLLLADTPGRYTPYQIGDCAFESKEEALKHAEEQRTNLIKSLKLQIHELENLKFECDD